MDPIQYVDPLRVVETPPTGPSPLRSVYPSWWLLQTIERLRNGQWKLPETKGAS